jgi:hypothetical protein
MEKHETQEEYMPGTEYDLQTKLDTTTAIHKEEVSEILANLPKYYSAPVAESIRHYAKLIEVLHPWIFRTSQTLAAVGLPSSYEPIRQTLPLFDHLFLKDLLQVELAQNMIWELESATDRARALLELVVEIQVPSVAQAYLARVARCFTWGYTAECLILCRSVLEHVLEEAVPNTDVFSVYTWRPEAFPEERRRILREQGAVAATIGDRINAARAIGRISDGDATAARTIRDRGNKAVHEAPPAGVDVLGTVRDLMRIIKILLQEDGPPRSTRHLSKGDG